MNIKPMLLRLESAMGRTDLVEKMVLLPGEKASVSQLSRSAKSVNFIVGYNSSPKSQTALDITLCIAHQTRLATSKEVTVQVVYIIDETQSADGNKTGGSTHQAPCKFRETASLRGTIPVVMSDSELTTEQDSSHFPSHFSQKNQFEQADKLLWQARCLADEWRGLFKAHLRFGPVATELRKVVEAEAATLLVLGCSSAKHPLVQELGPHFPCSVLGIPTVSYEEWYLEESFKTLQIGVAMPRHL